jgi:hypothetical protein
MCDAKLIESKVEDEQIVRAPACQLLFCEVDLVARDSLAILVVEHDASVSILLALAELYDYELAYSFYGWLASLDWLDWCLELHFNL